MSEIEKYSDSVHPALWPCLERLPLAIKRAAVQDLKECPRSRDAVADELSRLMRRSITVAQIDAVLAETKPHRFPAEWIPAWVYITGSRRILEVLCTESGYFLADQTDCDFAEYGRAAISNEKLSAHAEALKKALWSRA